MINQSWFAIVSMFADGIDRKWVKDYRKKGNDNCDRAVQRIIIEQ
jgi:hypothetical protein